MKIGDWVRQGWRTLGADLAGLAAVAGLVPEDERTVDQVHSGWRSLGRLRVLTVVVVALDVALLIRAATLVDGSLLPAFSVGERVVVGRGPRSAHGRLYGRECPSRLPAGRVGVGCVATRLMRSGQF